MAIRRAKSPVYSPTFKPMNRSPLRSCAETADAARKTIETSKRLTAEARELIGRIEKQRQKKTRTTPSFLLHP